jgi:hypothetical protein
MIRGIVTIAVLIAAIFYSLRVAPNDLRQILARAVPFVSSRLPAMLK